MKIGDIYKSKNGTNTNQTFIMMLNEIDNCVLLFDNMTNSIIGDTTMGFNMNDFELSSIRELSDFVINNNL